MNHSELEDKIAGIVERVTFHSNETGWSVLKVAPFCRSHEIVTVIVHQSKVFAGASMDFYGQWINHPKFGEQFKATRILERKPSSVAALEKYIGSGLIKGVGPKTAKKIVNYFGAQTMQVFEERIENLLNVPGIAQKKLAHISQSWNDHRTIRDIMMFLQTHGISTLYAVKIYKTYGNKSIEVVMENPYRLARDIYGIGFHSADKIAMSIGVLRDAHKRINAGVKHVLSSSCDDGHCYLTSEQILTNTKELLGVSDDQLIFNCLRKLVEDREIMLRKLLLGSGTIDCYYSRSLYWSEDYIAKKIGKFNKVKIDIDEDRVSQWIEKFCSQESIALSDEQMASVLGATKNSFSILTGGPGCGKTTTTRVLVHLLKAMKKRVLLAAPTGRAAQRMSEVIGHESKTVHRLLEWVPQKGRFKRGEEFPLEADFLIVDECSMLDVNLAASLLKAADLSTQVLFIGDPDQLPSVGAGNVLLDLLKSRRVVHHRLYKIFRQAEASKIIKYAHEMNKGIIPKVESPLENPGLWKDKVDCLMIDSDEATVEQLKFIRKAKHIISSTLKDDKKYLVKTGDELLGELKKGSEGVCFDRNLLEDDEPAGLGKSIFNIPKKFQHVDLEKISLDQSDVEDLKRVMKKIHPWSSLHYGLTAIDTIKRLYTKTIPQHFGRKVEIQILTPQIRGSLGTNNLNYVIQNSVNPRRLASDEIVLGDKVLRKGDRVIQTRNNYDLGVFNGDIGIINGIDSQEMSCSVHFAAGFDSREITYKKDDLPELLMAYAITIHKSQGSEFEAVIIPVTTQHFKMLFRNLLYTGVTRAKKLAIFVGNRRALAMAIKNEDSRLRQTALTQLI